LQYKNFNDSVRLSRLGMGAMRLPVKEGEVWSAIDYGKAQKIIDYAYNKGINYYDTAYIYHGGKSEVFLSKALSKYPRDSYYLADKYNFMVNIGFEEQFQEQLKRLNTDYIDFYMLHGLQDPLVDRVLEGGCIPYFESLKSEGKIRNFGFSFHGSIEAFRRLVSSHKWDFVMIQLNYYDWAYGDTKELYKILKQENIPIMVMEPLRGGNLASLTPEAETMLSEVEPERSTASWAMRWLFDFPEIAIVLSGMSNVQQAEDNIKTFEEFKLLNDSQKELLMKACELYRHSVAMACTNCRYCIADCPQKLDIPSIISVYNEVKMDMMWRLSFLENLSNDKRPKDCTGCGICVRHCPQGLDIPACMTQLNEWLSK